MGRARAHPADRARARSGRPARLSAPEPRRRTPGQSSAAALRRISVLRPVRSASIGVPGSESSGVKSHSIAASSVNPASDRTVSVPCSEARTVHGWSASGRRGLCGVGQVSRHEEGRGDDEDARVAAPDADDAALLHDPAHLGGVEAEPVGDIRDGEPLVDQAVEGLCRIVHPTRVRIGELHPRNSPVRFPRVRYSDTFAFCHSSHTGTIRSLSHHEVGTMSHQHATARRVATGTGATLALAVVAVTATARCGPRRRQLHGPLRRHGQPHRGPQRHHASAAIARANSLADASRIRIGQVLTIPTGVAPRAGSRARRACARRGRRLHGRRR